MTIMFLLMTVTYTGLGFVCLAYQKHFKSWKDDRALDRLCGVCWGWAGISFAAAIVSVIF